MRNNNSYRLLLSCFIVFFVSGSVWSQSTKQQELEKRRELIKQEMLQLQRLRESNNKKEVSILTEVEDLDTQIKLRSDLIKVTNSQANLLTREINDNFSKMENLREELSILKEDYGEMIRKSYKSKSGQSTIMFLLSSESFTQAYKRTQYMKQYTNYRKKQGEQIKERTALLQETNKKLVIQKQDKETLIAENRTAKASLDKEKERQAELVGEIRKRSSTYTSQIKKKQQETDRIDKQIDKIIADAIAESNKKAGKSTKTNKGFALTPAEVTLAKEFSNNKGKLIWPVERGRVTRRFGKSAHPTLPGITVTSSGVEIETSPDATARAVFTGEVTSIQDMGGYFTVFIRHGDYLTVYTNLKNIKVKAGDKITYKQELGQVSRNAFSGKTILKFSVRKNTSKLNPADWILNM